MDTRSIYLTQEVTDAINGELHYQNQMGGTARADEVDNGYAGQLLTMEEYLQLARQLWVRSSGNVASLDVLRKVVATGVRALVRFGCPQRGGIVTLRLPLQNIDHGFDVERGEIGVTIRKGTKWAHVPRDAELVLFNCGEAHSGECTPATCRYCGEGVKRGHWVGKMKHLPKSLLALEHNTEARDLEVLNRMMRTAYGDDFGPETVVTALIYERTIVGRA